MAITANVSLTKHEEQTLQVIAQQTGVTQAELLQKAVQLLIADFEHPYPQIVRRQQLQLDEAAKQQARQCFERHFGTLPAHYAGSAENEQIDADLAQSYTT
jgi:hypothetical protein